MVMAMSHPSIERLGPPPRDVPLLLRLHLIFGGTNMRVNDQTVYKLRFDFQASDGCSHTVDVRTHETERVEDEPVEKVVYDPFGPESAVVLDSLPGSFTVDEMGQIRTAHPFKAIAALILPFLTIVGHGMYLLLR